MWDIDAKSATEAIDSVIAQLTAAAQQRLHDLPDDDVAAVRSALDASPLLSLMSGSAPLFEAILGRLRATYERTADCCVAELAAQFTLQAAALAIDNTEKVRRHVYTSVPLS